MQQIRSFGNSVNFLWSIQMKIYTSFQKIFFVVNAICLLDTLPLKAEQIEFSLMDNLGRQVSSQDYEGVPVFLEFGACW
jgi:hypothetical protein